MGWFRPRLKVGACLALVALALNLAFAFGHHHFEELARGSVATEHSTVAPHSGDDDDSDHHGSTTAHPCFACVVVTAAAIAASPPALPARLRTQDIGVARTLFELRHSKRTSFEARAPPHS